MGSKLLNCINNNLYLTLFCWSFTEHCFLIATSSHFLILWFIFQLVEVYFRGIFFFLLDCRWDSLWVIAYLKMSLVSVVMFSCLVVSDTLWPHRLHHTRPPCPSSYPGACSDSCPLSWWCHPTISSSVSSFCFLSFPASGSFPLSWLFASGGQSIGASASASVLPMTIQELISFRIDWFDLLAVQGTLNSLLQHHSSEASILGAQSSLWSNSHIYTWILEKPWLWL